jgi:hypothetical protein
LFFVDVLLEVDDVSLMGRDEAGDIMDETWAVGAMNEKRGGFVHGEKEPQRTSFSRAWEGELQAKSRRFPESARRDQNLRRRWSSARRPRRSRTAREGSGTKATRMLPVVLSWLVS